LLIEKLTKTKNNIEFLLTINKWKTQMITDLQKDDRGYSKA
jgi:hypothetical protein